MQSYQERPEYPLLFLAVPLLAGVLLDIVVHWNIKCTKLNHAMTRLEPKKNSLRQDSS